MKTNTRASRDSRRKTAIPQVPKTPVSVSPGNSAAAAPPPWMTVSRLAFLKALAANKTRYSLQVHTLIALLDSEFGVQITPGDDTDLVFMAELGYVEQPRRNCWRITDAGLDSLAQFDGKHNRAKSPAELVAMIRALPLRDRRDVLAMVNRLYKHACQRSANGGAR